MPPGKKDRRGGGSGGGKGGDSDDDDDDDEVSKAQPSHEPLQFKQYKDTQNIQVEREEQETTQLSFQKRQGKASVAETDSSVQLRRVSADEGLKFNITRSKAKKEQTKQTQPFAIDDHNLQLDVPTSFKDEDVLTSASRTSPELEQPPKLKLLDLPNNKQPSHKQMQLNQAKQDIEVCI